MRLYLLSIIFNYIGNDKNSLPVYYAYRHIQVMSMNNDNISIRCIISGKVQGVFFRASTREQALQLNITGYAKNLSNGNVEVLANGMSNQVEQLKEWLQHGPQHAVVDKIECEIINDQTLESVVSDNFKIL